VVRLSSFAMTGRAWSRRSPTGSSQPAPVSIRWTP